MKSSPLSNSKIIRNKIGKPIGILSKKGEVTTGRTIKSKSITGKVGGYG